MGNLMKIDQVIEEELKIISARRKRKSKKPRAKSNDPISTPENLPTENSPDKDRCDALIGLALSGGGIRSAATNLGVLQGLSERGILPKVDYLSTVSGGGYIGACLSSLLSNNHRRKSDSPSPYIFDDDDHALFATDWDNFPFREDRIIPKEVAKQDELCGKIQMDHIRTRASYLATRARHFSPTVMRAVGSVFASTFMSLLWFVLLITVLTSTYMAVVAFVAPDLKMAPGENLVSHIKSELKSDGAFSFSVAAKVAGKKFEKTEDHSEPTKDAFKKIAGYAKTPFTKFWAIQSHQRWIISGLIIVLGAISLYWISRLSCASRIFREKYCHCFLVYLGGLVALLGLAYWLNKIFPIKEVAEGAILLVPSLFAGGALIGGWLSFVIASRYDASWRIADRSHLHQLIGVLVIGFLFTLFLAVLPGFMSVGTSFFNSLLLLAFGTGLRYALAGNGDKKGQKNKKFTLPPKYREWLLGLCTLIFVFLAVVYTGNIIRDTWLGGNWPANVGGIAGVIKPFSIMLMSLTLLFAFPLLVDANKISPHYFYRDRLAETFLQTKISEYSYLRNDAEMKLADLHGTNDNNDEKCAARGPYLLMNATLNLTASEDLKAFNRKSDIFTFSRCFIGSKRTGYIETDAYHDMTDSGETLKLARAMSISGAAMTSVMGMNSSLARSFACTILGVRLGYWLKNFSYVPQINKELEIIDVALAQVDSETSQAGNSKNKNLAKRKHCYEKARKCLTKQKARATNFYRNNLGRLFKELIGHTTATEKEIYLSDGGHSGDNLGIIPLLQRRVKLLLVSDSECDPDHIFNSFNSSVRNAYVDEGIRIVISLGGLTKDEKGLTKGKFAVGRIYYPEQGEKQENWLVLYKNTLTGNEIAPIVNYHRKSRDFPHESTGDQFFTEEQFESYRALGRFAVKSAFESQNSWQAVCRASANNMEVKCEGVYNFLAGLCVNPGMDDKSAMHSMQE